ncbi:UDP-N-acetylglucosamine 1-carboxyvinyltransferase [Clostridiales bacterium BAD-6]|uniref:UDP-N-acetylglucosamine 1-carboxyvinyltransferase n=2 Tax=Sinanaerobacter chloroacetimidivorans TaxID=2818044 RepID=A0A8J7W0N3_9FIRM|nr:UDP-N-acetylglucosamine 1-carboxyvinyltransferase [Sinanaerobacter chloroacetimidivorans]
MLFCGGVIFVDHYRINGGNRLSGEYELTGAKNAVLPILAATIVTGNKSKIKSCPDLSDVRTMLFILQELGCKVTYESDGIVVDSSTIDSYTISESLMREMRSSVFLMGPMIARCGKVILSYPGGCEIGLRPIDIHLSALRRLGVSIKESHGFLECTADKLVGNRILMDFPSVGATENAMMAATAAEGETRIINPAKEPEIVDLQNFLNSCGAEIRGAGTGEIVINGGKSYHEIEHKVIPDRIEGGTILAAVAMTGGNVLLKNAMPEHMSITLSKLREAGCKIKEGKDFVELIAPNRLKAIETIRTQPYPGFPTDMQSQLLTVMTVAQGTSVVTETIFESRFKHVEELRKMGAKVKVDGRTAIITGVKSLTGARVFARDLRGGASLVIAGLGAEGETIVENIHHIDRGYDRFESALQRIGADIVRA